MTSSSKTTWILVTDGTNLFDSEVRAGALELAHERGCHRILLVNEHSLSTRLRRDPKIFERESFAILSHVRQPAVLRAIGKANTPCVLLGEEAVDDWRRAFGGPLAVCSVNNAAIGQLAADYLHDLERFKSYVYADFASESAVRWWSGPRYAAFAATLAEHGFSGKVPRCILGGASGGDSQPGIAPAEAYRRFRTLVASLPRPIAVLACNDRIAAEVAAYAEMSEMHVPDDLALLGVDDDRALCETAATSISSIRIEHRRLGRTAMAMLLRMCDGGALRTEKILCPPVRVVERDSTRRHTPANAAVARASAFIEQASPNAISVSSVVGASGASRSYLEKRFRKETGRTILGAIHKRLFEEIARRVLDTNDPIAEIAQFTGFSSSSGLCTFFRRMTGMSISAYRARHRPASDRRGQEKVAQT